MEKNSEEKISTEKINKTDTGTSEKDPFALNIVKQIIEQGLKGNKTLKFAGAEEIALRYKNDLSFKNNDKRVEALIKSESGKNFTSGFITGIGGIFTLPVSVSASLLASWVIYARLCAAIAIIYGHDPEDERVRLAILLLVMGDSGKNILKEAGLGSSDEITIKKVKNFTPKLIWKLYNQVAGRIAILSAKKSLVRIVSRVIPGVSGLIAGGTDAYLCRSIGKEAKRCFRV